MESSGADKGYFQPSPVLANQFYDDTTYQRCFKLFLSPAVATETEPEVAALGNDVLSDQVLTWITDAERNKPYLKGSGRDVFGKWKGELVTGEGWRQLQNFGISKGMIATGYDTPYGLFARPLQFLRLHLWEPSSANVTCPSAMQDGAARLLQLHLTTPDLAARLSQDERVVFENAFAHLTNRNTDLAWTSGQWMTERSGGSDVSQTETTAVLKEAEPALSSVDENIPLGPWSINGFKWFSSATDANMSILLARTPAGGISAFMAPMRRHDPLATTSTGQPKSNGQKSNGVRIQRLKEKHGTRPLPTAELVLEDMRGWLIGREGRGVAEISTVLTLTRVHSAVTAVAYVGRGLGIARAYARVREIAGITKGTKVKLTGSALHMRTLANMTAEYRGLMLLSFYASYVLGLSEHPDSRTHLPPALAVLAPTKKATAPLLRVLTQVSKAYVCKACVPLLHSCMESLGGIGYLLNEEEEYLNIARLYRDASVLPIWEGTTDVLSVDVIKTLKHPKNGESAIEAVESCIKQAIGFEGRASKPSGWDPLGRWSVLNKRITTTSEEALMGGARDILWELADILVSVLLFVDAGNDGDTVAQDIMERFVGAKFGVHTSGSTDVRDALERDLAIVYGNRAEERISKL